jgi:anti-sigma regulatory factor (Ser/Thr protein kinase)
MPDQAAEGGFGWPLIRALSDEIRLARKRGLNVLTVRIRPDTAGHGQ